MKINENIKDGDEYLDKLITYIYEEFEAVGISTNSWEHRIDVSPGYQAGVYNKRRIHISIFSKTEEIEDVDYSNERDKNILSAFITDGIKHFMASNDWPEKGDLELDDVDFWYPGECARTRTFEITINYYLVHKIF